ncbi:MAG: Tex-like N-terminal domain-containing protein [Planctomycetaceae bacterium]
MDTPIQVDLGRIAQDLQIRRVQVESVVQLLDEGNTVPFITRYRKERTGNLNEVTIREIQVRVGRLRELAERKETILKAIEAQGKLTDELAAAIRGADNPKRLEDLYLPFKPKKKTKASEARDKGLEPLAQRIWNRDEALTDLHAAAQEFVNAEKGVEAPEQAIEGAGHILAEAISELATVRDAIRRVVWKTGKIVTTKAEIPEGEGLEYRDYFNYSEPISHIPPHRVLAINRGDKEGPLKVKLEVSRPDLESALFGNLPLEGHPQAEFFRTSALDALDRLLLPSMEREVRRDLTDLAERHAVDVFARNLRSLLLQPPIPKQVVLAIDPGFRTGCKVAILDPHGNLLEHDVIHPHPPQNRRHEAKLFLKDLVGKHQVGVVAIGNGTACRETEELIAEIIAEGTQFSQAAESATETESAAASPEATPAAETPVEPADTPTPEPPAGPMVAANPEAPVATAIDTPEEVPVEALPPLSGGAPEQAETQTESEPTAADASPPASSPGEAASPEAEGRKADQLDKSEQTQGPVREGEGATPAEIPAAGPEAIATPEAVSEPTPPPTPTAEIPAQAPAPAAAPGGGKPGRPEQQRPPRTKPAPVPPKPHPADPLLAALAYVIVNEAGASVYSASPIGREEFPDFDATLRGTISIGRRLQDPLAELVKIEPQSIGVGLYQHDVNAKQLKESLEAVISSCVNFVGVDLNTASVPLLRHVSGLNQLTARRVVEFRKEKGAFTNREQLMQVEGIGPTTYTQAAGFLKIPGGDDPLDRTWVHPESYGAATKLLEELGFTPEVVRHRDQLPALHEKLNELDIPATARELEVGEPTLRDICDDLARPDRDPREDLPKPIFKRGVLKLEDLTPGMELKGTVLNVVDFGAFVDIGLKDSGLVHISQLANRYIKSPHDVVSVGDVVTAWVMGVDHERKRVSLTMVKPGTERPRGAPAGGRRGGPDGPRERRGGPPQQRPPRREGPGLSATPPVGTVSGTPEPLGGEGPPRREHQPAGRGPGGGGQRPGGPGGREGGPGRGGPRPQGPGGGQGQGRFERPQTSRPPAKPSKPAAPPPPLSKDALSGSVPLRTFGQLKQLWQARVEETAPNPPSDEPPAQAPAPEPTPPPEAPPAEQTTDEGAH